LIKLKWKKFYRKKENNRSISFEFNTNTNITQEGRTNSGESSDIQSLNKSIVSKEEISRAGDFEISLNALDDHKKRGDMCPIPKEGCPIKVCHATGSITNPYEVIDISTSGLEEHKKHGAK